MRSASSHSDVDRVRDATDLVQLIGEHITLRPKGREHVGLCPFHDDRTPSMAVVTHKGNAFYKCHACGAGGDAFDFVRNYHKMDFPEALRYLAERAGITLTPRERDAGLPDAAGPRKADLREANGLAAMFFRKVLQSSSGEVGQRLLRERGINEEMSEAFLLGLAPDAWDGLLNVIRKRNLSEAIFEAAGLLKQRKDSPGHYDAFRNRLIFPICNDLGQPVAFGARKINPEDEPKYLNSAESPLFQKSKTLYGMHLAKRAIIEARQAIVTEGYTDVIACHQAGVRNVVGTLGTALTQDHARMLSRLCDTVILIFDGDEAGQKAADRGVEVFFAEPVDIKICVLPDRLDPDELLHTEGGRDRFLEIVKSAEDALAFKVRRFRRVLDGAGGVSARQRALEQFLGELADMGFTSMQGVRKRLVMTQLADLLGITIQDLAAALPVRRKPVAPQRVESSRVHAEHESGDELPVEQDVPEATVVVSRARRRAEHELLAVLVYDPSLGLEPITVGDTQANAVFELFREDHFLDGAARRIARSIFSFIERQQLFTMQQLLAELGEGEASRVASSLYFEGERLCEPTIETDTQPLHRAAEAFLSHMDVEAFHRSVAAFKARETQADSPIDALQRLIEQRRKQGTIAGAISLGVRS